MLNIGNLPKRNNESGTFPVYNSKTFSDFEKFSALWIALKTYDDNFSLKEVKP